MLHYLELKAGENPNPKFPKGTICSYPYPSTFTKMQGLAQLIMDKLWYTKLLPFPPELPNCGAWVEVESGVWQPVLNPDEPGPGDPKDDGQPRINAVYANFRDDVSPASWLMEANARGAADVRILRSVGNGWALVIEWTPGFRYDGTDLAGSYMFYTGHLPAGNYRAYWRPHNSDDATKLKFKDFTVTTEQANKTRPSGGGEGDSDYDYTLINDALIESGNDGDEQANDGSGGTQRQPKTLKILTPDGTTTTEGFQLTLDAELTYDDGSKEIVSVDEQTDWQVASPNQCQGGILYVPEDGVYGNTRTVTVVVTHRGLSDSRGITVRDGTVPPNEVVDVDIEGEGDIREGTGENYRAVKILTDGSRVYTSEGSFVVNDAGGTAAYFNATTKGRLELPANNVQDDSSTINIAYQLGNLVAFKDVLGIDATPATVPRFERITRRWSGYDLFYYVATSLGADGSFQPLEWRHKPNFQGNASAWTDWQPYGGAISVDFEGYTYARALLYTGGGGPGTSVTYEFRIEGNNASILSDTFVLLAQNTPPSTTLIYPNS